LRWKSSTDVPCSALAPCAVALSLAAQRFRSRTFRTTILRGGRELRIRRREMTTNVFVAMGLAVSLVSWAEAGAGAQSGAQGAAGGKTTTVTGCLAKGADASSYMLNNAMPAGAAKDESSKQPSKGSEAKSYQVMAKESSLKLADHVGHTVTITGTVDEMAGGSGAGSSKAGAAGSTGGASGSSAGGAGSTGGAAAGSAAAKSGASKTGSMPHLMATSMKHVATTCTQ
jgi:hypothetical protein